MVASCHLIPRSGASAVSPTLLIYPSKRSFSRLPRRRSSPLLMLRMIARATSYLHSSTIPTVADSKIDINLVDNLVMDVALIVTLVITVSCHSCVPSFQIRAPSRSWMTSLHTSPFRLGSAATACSRIQMQEALHSNLARARTHQ